MICKNCKNEIPDKSSFCLYCGTKQPENPKKQIKGKKVVKKNTNDHLFLLIIIIAVSIIAFYLLYPEKKQEKLQSLQTIPEATLHQELNSTLDLLKNDPDNYTLLVRAGNAYFDVEKYDMAIKYYEKALAKNSTQPDVIIDAGVCYYNLKKLDKAEDYFNKALEINPKHAVGLYNLGIVLSAMGKPQEAAEIWHKILDVAPDSPQARTIEEMLHANDTK